MIEPARFDPASCPMAGITLIEASAGTGKTYNITRVYLRMLLERERIEPGNGSPENSSILIVTFTKAATAELRDRIRELISRSLVYLKTAGQGPHGIDPADTALLSILDRAKSHSHDRSVAVLEEELSRFDEAAIYTIHGFASRILRKYAFESGLLFDLEAGPDDVNWYREAAMDFFRKHITSSRHIGFLEFLQSHRINVEYFTEFIRTLSEQRNAVLPAMNEHDRHEPSLEKQSLEKQRIELSKNARTLERKLEQVHARLHKDWIEKSSSWLAAIEAEVGKSLKSNKLQNIHWQASRLDLKIRRSAYAFLAPDRGSRKDSLDFFCLQSNDSVKSKSSPDHILEHSITMSLEDLKTLLPEIRFTYRKLLYLLEATAFIEGPELLESIKEKRKRMGYSDMLHRLDNALRHPHSGPVLTGRIQEEFSGALIDEFQDTDPVQWSIFRKLFGSNSHPLFLIGDPRQSIYSFRGSDLGSYLQSAKKAQQKFTLSSNFRSTAELIKGINEIFKDRAELTFQTPGIHYEEVEAGRASAQDSTQDSGQKGEQKQQPEETEKLAPIEIHIVKEPEQTRGSLNSQDLQNLTRKRVLERIFILLQSVNPGDIAILFRNHRQAEEMQSELRLASIPSVIQSDKKVIQTDEAKELLVIMEAIDRPDSRVSLRRCLVTTIMGFTLMDLDQSGLNESVIPAFRSIAAQRRHGFLPMLHALMHSESFQIYTRLLRLRDGERKITNLIHLGEIIHAKKLPGLSADIKWLRDEIQSPDQEATEREIRLESDASCVNLITAHVSKGLEYPVVLIPDARSFRPPEKQRSQIILQKTDADPDLEPEAPAGTLWTENLFALNELQTEIQGDFLAHRQEPEQNIENEIKEHKKIEQIHEEIRLLYVAMTRAKIHLELFVSEKKSKSIQGIQAIEFLLCENPREDTTLNALSVRQRFASVSDTIAVNEINLASYVDRGHVSGISSTPASTGDKDSAGSAELHDLHYTPFPDEISDFRPGYVISSFSRLVSGHPGGPDRDLDTGTPPPPPSPFESYGRSSAEAPEDPGLPRASVHSLPGGIATGNLVHSIFENIDFTDLSSLSPVVAEQTAKHNYNPEYIEIIEQMVAGVLQQTIHGPGDSSHSFRLEQIGMDRRFSELPFHMGFVAEKIGPDSFPGEDDTILRKTLSLHSIQPEDGYLRGYIDLMFEYGNRYYILDWKTNRLGQSDEDYTHEAMEEEMIHAGYSLQYYIYLAALDHHLKRTVPGYDYHTHMGGAIYAFTRGYNSTATGGLYIHRPSYQAIQFFQSTRVSPKHNTGQSNSRRKQTQ